MTDREKVIKGLEQCVGYEDADNEYSCIYDGDTNPNCPYAGTGGNGVSCMTKMMRDALALLKAQEPRVMTLEEVNALDWDYCYLEEERLPGKEYRLMCGEHILTCVTWPSITAAKITYGCDGYGKRWRCWTSRPTEAEREATPWET